MRPTYTYIASRARQVIIAVLFSISLSAGTFSADSLLLRAYQREEMEVWKTHLDTAAITPQLLIYEYGLSGYMVDRDKANALPYVKRFRRDIEALKSRLPKGHYEMYMSAVYVFELRLHESFHPATAMSLAKKATQLAPNDPLTLSYYGTSLFYAPKPFGSKSEALEWFEKAENHFRAPQWKYCWIREATLMYIEQCHEKLKKH